ncbi:MAG TPA: GIY-YIG nuclease family protein [Allosphingosinicella sp.]|nr:GIY-YIG nuclease family protein [Allosphingosinicella sp.]
MLHCADGSFYVGHTDDLEVRIATHRSGEFGGYTSTRLPVALAWCDEFPSRYEALSAERRIKGWSRAKKLALVRGDWPLISRLAKNRSEREKERASTGSARTEGEAGSARTEGEASTGSARTEGASTSSARTDGASTGSARADASTGSARAEGAWTGSARTELEDPVSRPRSG